MTRGDRRVGGVRVIHHTAIVRDHLVGQHVIQRAQIVPDGYGRPDFEFLGLAHTCFLQ